jgi:hypothetical protein
MSKHSISQSLWHRNRPISFLEGAAAVFDWQPLIDRYSVSLHDLYPSKETLDAAIANGSTSGTGEKVKQLEELLVTLRTSVGRSEI